MALHRDIYWVGRQWAVTGYGLQAVDQKLKSKFDIEVSRLWEDGLLENMGSERWLNIEDFGKALSIARARYPQPVPQAAPAEPDVPAADDGGGPELPIPFVAGVKPTVPKFEMQVASWPARFIRSWRIGIRAPRV